MIFSRRSIALALLAALLAAGCELSPRPQATPTINAPTDTLTLVPSLTLTPTLSPVPQLESPTSTYTPGPPTDTPTDTPTWNPYATYVIQQNDTMYYILQQPPFYYASDSWNRIIDQILKLNPFMRSADQLPGPGSSILIPLPTLTPPGAGGDQTAQPNVQQVSVPSNAQITQVAIAEGQTIIGIAESNSTTLPILATLNPQLQFLNCDFTNPSGGPDCNVNLRVGDLVNVPELTPTPTLSPTISGSETVTPTPTYSAPIQVFPPQEGSAPPRSFQLEWISVGVLQDNEVYLVEIQDQTAGTQHLDVTRGTSYQLPDSLIPSDGQTHTIQWRVSVAAPNDQGAYRYIGAQGDWRTFYWQSK